MKSLTQSGKSGFLKISATALVFLVGVPQIGVASDPQYYEGTAALCAVSPNMFLPPETKGNNGILYVDDLIMVWQIKSADSELMNGTELMHASWKQTKSGTQFQSGELVMTPDVYVGTGAFEEKFKFKIDPAAPITGTYTGTGDLKGVSADYELTPNEGVFCEETFDWASACPTCMPFNPGGYNMSGWIYGLE
jgi:hypothetical protein